MSSPELSQPTAGNFSPQDFYDACRNALLTQGAYCGDAHYLKGSVELAQSATGLERPVPGSFVISDYQDFETTARNGRPNDKAALQGLLEDPSRPAIFDIMFRHDGDGEDAASGRNLPFYVTFRPDTANPNSMIGFYVNPTRSGDRIVQPPIPIPAEESGKIIVVRTTQLQTATYDVKQELLERPTEDQQLCNLFAALGGVSL